MMPQGMGRDALFQPGHAARLVEGVLEGIATDVASGKQAREEPLAVRPGAPPVVAQGLLQARREHDEAVLALLHADDCAAADDLGDAQPGPVAEWSGPCGCG